MFRVIYRLVGEPNGKLISEQCKYFDSYQDAVEFAKTKNFDAWDTIGVAFIEEFSPCWHIVNDGRDF